MIVELVIVDEDGRELGRAPVETVTLEQPDGSTQVHVLNTPAVAIARTGVIAQIWVETPMGRAKCGGPRGQETKEGWTVHLPSSDGSPLITVRFS